MSQEKYIGMDVHQATISVAVMDAGGNWNACAVLVTSSELQWVPCRLHVLSPTSAMHAG